MRLRRVHGGACPFLGFALTGFLDSEARPCFGFSGVETWAGRRVPPSFLSSSPATWQASAGLAVKEISAGLVRPAGARRGHGHARLDGQASLARVAARVMKEGKTKGAVAAAEQ